WLDNNIELVPQPIVSRWEFEEGTGSDVNDSSANSFGGYMVNMDPCTAWVAGHGGGWALDFDGLDDHIVIGDSNQGNFRFTGDGITWSAWIKTSSTGSTMRVIMGISPDSMANESGTKMFMVDRGRLTLRGMNADLGGETTVTVNDGQWHHVAVTVKFDTYGEDDTLLFYIDANSDGGSIERNINRHSDAGFRITIGDGVWSAFDGLIDDVQVYNEALDANGILQIYEEGSFVPPEQLVCVKYLAKDLNEDCKVDFLDYAILVDNWLNIPALWP
ncbi:MAG: LamG domain-containing protein, partial [Planctomycetota bacterium]